MHGRRLAVHRHIQDAERSAEIFDDALQPQTDAEHRDAPLDQEIESIAGREILGPARPRREHHQIRPHALLQLLAAKSCRRVVTSAPVVRMYPASVCTNESSWSINSSLRPRPTAGRASACAAA